MVMVMQMTPFVLPQEPGGCGVLTSDQGIVNSGGLLGPEPTLPAEKTPEQVWEKDINDNLITDKTCLIDSATNPVQRADQENIQRKKFVKLSTDGSTGSRCKRKLDFSEDDTRPPTKRFSVFCNTPKQRRDQKKKFLRLSIKKLKAIDDHELGLLRAVLLNNTARRIQQELKREKLGNYSCSYGMNYCDNIPTGYLSDNKSYRQDDKKFWSHDTDVDSLPAEDAAAMFVDSLDISP